MASIKLSEDLLNRLLATLAEHDENAKEPQFAAQYLAAVMGLLIAEQDFTQDQKEQLLEELQGLAKYVIQQRSQQPPAQEAFGIWRPGDG